LSYVISTKSYTAVTATDIALNVNFLLSHALTSIYIQNQISEYAAEK